MVHGDNKIAGTQSTVSKNNYVNVKTCDDEQNAKIVRN